MLTWLALLSGARAADGSAIPPPGTVVTGPVVTLAQATAAALAGSPLLSELEWDSRARDADVLQASLRLNPDLELTQENFAGTGSVRAWNAAETTLAVEQRIELGEKRARRVALAEADRRLAAWDHVQARRRVMLAVAEEFARTLTAQVRVERARALVEVETRMRDTVARGLRAGAVSEVDARRAALSLARATGEVERLAGELAQARAALAATWGASEPTFDAVQGELAPSAPPPELEVVLARADALPESTRQSDEIERGRAAVALAESLAIPDLTVGAGIRHLAEDDDVALVARVAVPLPFFDRNQGAIAAALHEAERSRSQASAARFGRSNEIRALHRELCAAYQRVQRIAGALVPEAEGVVRDAREAFARGLFRLSDVLDTQRSLYELRLEELDALEEYYRARVVLELTAGTSPNGEPDRLDGGGP